jgi:2-C-methyl-D-erythritol 4-phosphate cytidylyltransferase
LLAFEQEATIDCIVLVVGEADVERCHQYREQYGLHKLQHIVIGGNERQQSVYRGLQVIAHDFEYVLIHDGVRPFVTTDIFTRIRNALTNDQWSALVTAVPVKDTVKTVNLEHMTIDETLARERLWAIQTPQAFRMSTILAAHQEAIQTGFLGTDDAVLVERMGENVRIIKGDDLNLKITTPNDLLLAEAIIRLRQKRREIHD